MYTWKCIQACLDLITGDMSMAPTGSDNEPEDDEREADREAEVAKEYASSTYRKDEVCAHK